jgi:hypothetical protein
MTPCPQCAAQDAEIAALRREINASQLDNMAWRARANACEADMQDAVARADVAEAKLATLLKTYFSSTW